MGIEVGLKLFRLFLDHFLWQFFSYKINYLITYNSVKNVRE